MTMQDTASLQDDDDPSINPNDDGERTTNLHPFRRQQDPQVTVTGRIKQGAKGELIVFTVPLALFELVCIVNIPAEGDEEAPVYCKFKVKRPRKERDGDDEE